MAVEKVRARQAGVNLNPDMSKLVAVRLERFAARMAAPACASPSPDSDRSRFDPDLGRSLTKLAIPVRNLRIDGRRPRETHSRL